MYSLICPRTAIFVRPLTSTYWMAPAYFFGRNLVNASLVSYRWLSASNSGYGNSFDVMAVEPLIRCEMAGNFSEPRSSSTHLSFDTRVFHPNKRCTRRDAGNG